MFGPGLLRHDGRGGQRARVEEDRDERQPHRDLVADHLRRRAQPAQQRVRGLRRPPGQHDPVDRHRAHGQHQQDGHGQVGELQGGLHAEDRDLGAERDDREADERGDHRDRGGQPEQQLVHVTRDDVFLQRQLDAVHERLEQAERPGPVRPRPLLHPADDPALRPDREQRHDHQEEEDEQDLDDHQPPGLVVEAGQGRVGRREHAGMAGGRSRQAPVRHAGQATHSALLRVTRLPCPATSSRRISEPADRVGSHTTRSGMTATSTGRVSEPRPVATVTLPPSEVPASRRGRR